MAAPRAHFRDTILVQVGSTLVVNASASVTVYQTGTTTKVTQTIYQTATGASTYANPFTAGADGLVEFWLPIEETVDLSLVATVVAPTAPPKTVTVETLVSTESGMVNVNTTQAIVNPGDMLVGANNGTLLTFESNEAVPTSRTVVTTAETQTLTNKIVTAPTLNNPTLSGTVSGTPAWASTQAVNISGTAPAGTLTGTTLNGTVVTSSLTSVGVLASPHFTSPVVDSGGLTVGGVTYLGSTHLIGSVLNVEGTSAQQLQVGYDGSHYVELNISSSGVVTFAVTNDGGYNFIATGLVAGVPTGGNKGAGTLNVASNIYLNNGAYTNPDAVFEHAFTGRVERFANAFGKHYAGLLPLADFRRYVRDHWRLPVIPLDDEPAGVVERFDWVLAGVEQAMLYILQLDDRLAALEAA